MSDETAFSPNGKSQIPFPLIPATIRMFPLKLWQDFPKTRQLRQNRKATREINKEDQIIDEMGLDLYELTGKERKTILEHTPLYV